MDDFLGPPLDQGPLPAIFYFALSAEDSLHLEPYCQVTKYFLDSKVRVFSLTLPGHGPGLDKKMAMRFWADEINKGNNIIETFTSHAKEVIDTLISQHVINPKHLAVMGLSRGGFMATHVAANDPRVQTILGFAPLTDLTVLTEFEDSPLASSLSLKHLAEKLTDKTLRFYIGNRDSRVGTSACFSFISHLTNISWEAGKRTPQVELFIRPSIGHKGHGTSEETFRDGADWLKRSYSH